VAYEERILSTQCDAAQVTFGRVVVQGQTYVADEAREFGPLLEGVGRGRRDVGLRWELVLEPEYRRVELLEQGWSAFAA
jgi:hypothetical protein